MEDGIVVGVIENIRQGAEHRPENQRHFEAMPHLDWHHRRGDKGKRFGTTRTRHRSVHAAGRRHTAGGVSDS